MSSQEDSGELIPPAIYTKLFDLFIAREDFQGLIDYLYMSSNERSISKTLMAWEQCLDLNPKCAFVLHTMTQFHKTNMKPKEMQLATSLYIRSLGLMQQTEIANTLADKLLTEGPPCYFAAN